MRFTPTSSRPSTASSPSMARTISFLSGPAQGREVVQALGALAVLALVACTPGSATNVRLDAAGTGGRAAGDAGDGSAGPGTDAAGDSGAADTGTGAG